MPTEKQFLAEYRNSDHPSPSVTVDLVIFTVQDADLKVLLIRRLSHPFQGRLALPGGFVRVGDAYDDQGEDVSAAARRELEEETGLPASEVYLEQLYTFGEAGRDPRKRVISVAHYALIRPDLAPMVTARGDASNAQWHSLSLLAEGEQTLDLPADPLAFDHAHILWTALFRIRGKIDYAPIAFDLVPATFTLPELRAVYEAIKGESYDPSNFRRRFKRMIEDGTIEQAPGKRVGGVGRPARVYRFLRP